MKCRLGELAIFFRRQRKSWQEAIKGNSVMARELNELINSPPVPAPYLSPVRSLRGAPVPYEVERGLANASDCLDWLNDNKNN